MEKCEMRFWRAIFPVAVMFLAGCGAVDVNEEESMRRAMNEQAAAQVGHRSRSRKNGKCSPRFMLTASQLRRL
jgi:hypothetical protein